MIRLAISFLLLNTSFRIQYTQFTSAPWSHTPRKQLRNFKHVILWSAAGTPFYKVHQTHQRAKFIEHVKHAKHLSTQSTWAGHLADSFLNTPQNNFLLSCHTFLKGIYFYNIFISNSKKHKMQANAKK